MVKRYDPNEFKKNKTLYSVYISNFIVTVLGAILGIALIVTFIIGIAALFKLAFTYLFGLV